MKTTVKIILFSSCLLLVGPVSTKQAISQSAEPVPKIYVVSSGSENQQQKLVSEIFTRAFAVLSGKAPKEAVSVSAVSDRQLHLDPLLNQKVFDAGIGWQKPDCNSSQLTKSATRLCEGFFFSKPIYKDVTSVFVKQSENHDKPTLADLSGKRLCTNRSDLGWPGSSDNILRVKSLRACFEMLVQGQVAGVISEHRAGMREISQLENSAELVALEAPVKKQTYHAIVAKSHPRARTFIYFINSAMDKLHRSGGVSGAIENNTGG